MNERIEQLESSVRRWKRACLGLVLVILCLLAGSGTVIGLLVSQLPGQFDLMMPWTRERMRQEEIIRAKEAEMRAMQEQEATIKAEAAKEREKQAAPEAGKNKGS
jgi:hypothetical protein